MSWSEQVIAAHQRALTEKDAKRAALLASWNAFRRCGEADQTINQALKLVSEGGANEVELAFHVLLAIGFQEPELWLHLLNLCQHKSVKVRSSLAFYAGPQLPVEQQTALYGALLADKAASVRIKTVQQIGMHALNEWAPYLQRMRDSEKATKVIDALNFWIPLLTDGFRTEVAAGGINITVSTRRGISSQFVTVEDPNDPRVLEVVREMKQREARLGGAS